MGKFFKDNFCCLSAHFVLKYQHTGSVNDQLVLYVVYHASISRYVWWMENVAFFVVWTNIFTNNCDMWYFWWCMWLQIAWVCVCCILWFVSLWLWYVYNVTRFSFIESVYQTYGSVLVWILAHRHKFWGFGIGPHWRTSPSLYLCLCISQRLFYTR